MVRTDAPMSATITVAAGLACRAAKRDDQPMRGSAVAPSPGVAVAICLSLTVGLVLLIPGKNDLMGFAGLAFGGAVAWFAGRRKQQRNEDFAVGRLTRSERVAVDRAVATSVAPSDPRLQETALVLARFRAARSDRGNSFLANAVLSLLLVVSLIFATTRPSLEHALSAVMFGLALALVTADLAWRRRRVTRLERTIAQLARATYL